MLQQLVRSIGSATYEQIPQHVRHLATLCILDGIGVGLAGASHPIVVRAERAAAALGNTGNATVLGRRSKQCLPDAALINGTAMQVHDFNDVHLGSRTHPSVAILPAVLAMAEARGSSGRDVLNAYLVGYEIETAIGASLLPQHYARGWHPTATIGVFGATAAVAQLLRLSPEAQYHALNLAGTQASGVRSAFGGMVKHIHPGKAAMNGLLAAVWAEAGITAGADTLADRLGFANASTGREASLPSRAADSWAIEQATIKRFPCCLEGHPAVELALRLHAAGFAAKDISSLTIHLHPDVLALVGHSEPDSDLSAKFSLPHCVALAIVHGTVAIRHFDQDPQVPGPVSDLRRSIRLIADDTLAYAEAVCEADDRSRRRMSEHILHPGGALVAAFTSEDVQTKFLSVASPILGSGLAKSLMDLILDLENLTDIVPLLAATLPDAKDPKIKKTRSVAHVPSVAAP